MSLLRAGLETLCGSAQWRAARRLCGLSRRRRRRRGALQRGEAALQRLLQRGALLQQLLQEREEEEEEEESRRRPCLAMCCTEPLMQCMWWGHLAGQAQAHTLLLGLQLGLPTQRTQRTQRTQLRRLMGLMQPQGPMLQSMQQSILQRLVASTLW